MTIDIGNVISLGQLAALALIVFRAGQLVQAFRDHVASDDRRFAAIERKLGLTQKENAI